MLDSESQATGELRQLLIGRSLPGTASSSADAEDEIRVVELQRHPFFVGTLFVPQMRSTPNSPHPLICGFLEACVEQGNG